MPTFPEKRGPDRRRHKLLSALFSRQRRRRHVGRRAEDRYGYVDVYDRRTWVCALSVLGLSLLDAVFTGAEVSTGKVMEVNPLMYAAMDRGGMATFVSIKAGMTALPLAFLVLHKEWPLARFTARLCLWSYILIALYHFYLVLVCV